MKEKYKAAFIIPVGTKKTLGEDGWEFETSKRFSTELSAFLMAMSPLNIENSPEQH